MDPVANPYTPNAGERPDVLVGRDDLLASFNVLLQRVARGRAAKSMIVTGLRGVGKTVLLGSFRVVALEQGWSVIEHEVSKHDDTGFRNELALLLRTALLDLAPRARWSNRFHRAAAAITSFTLTVDPQGQVKAGLGVGERIEGLADHGDLAMDLTDVLLAVGEAAQDKGTGVVILLDEIQFLKRTQFEALIKALHKTVQRSLPVVLVGAGLPQLPELAGDAKSYAERLFTFPEIGNLSEEDAARALREPARQEGADFTDEALAQTYEMTGGYPYFLQELGSAAWAVAEASPIDLDDVAVATDLYQSRLDASFFRVRLNRTTELQAAYLRAMAELGPGLQRSADVAELLGRESQHVGSVRSELIEMGLIYSPRHGFSAFTVPHFDKFMLRAVPELVPPPVKPRGIHRRK